MRTYDTNLFIDIIESIKGLQFIREEYKEGVRVRFYQGINGRLVVIECSDEDIDELQGKGYLRQLGLEHLVESLFPSRKPHVQ